MDRQMIMQHLALAEGHAAKGEQHIQRQRELIIELQSLGHNTDDAESLLQLFEETQRLHVADCKRLRRELESVQAAPSMSGWKRLTCSKCHTALGQAIGKLHL